MRYALLVILAIVVVLAVIGCGKRSQQTSATQVTNPPDVEPKAAAKAKAPEPAPAPIPPPAPKAAAPKPDKDGWVTLPSGLKYKDKKVGKGAEAVATQKVTVHYKGWLDNKTVFDSSRSHGEPFSFELGQGRVIRGWDEGVAGMRVGGMRELTIPAKLGYGDQDMGKIPPNSTLHFDVELLKVGE